MAEGELEILPSPGLQQNDAQRPTQGQIQIHILIHLSQNIGTDKNMNYLRDILKKIPRQKVVGTHPQKALFWHNDKEIPFEK